MRILFVSHRFPYPPTFGSKVRAFNMIRHLARTHEVSVLSLVRSDEEAQEAAGIAAHCHDHAVFRVHNPLQALHVGASLALGRSASEGFFHSGAMQREIDARLARRSCDLLVAHCSAVAPYLEQVHGLPKLMDLCDVDSRKWSDYVAHRAWPLSLGYRLEAARVAALERRIARSFDAVTLATEGEVQTLVQLGVTEPIDWFPNGVDLDYFQPGTEPHDPDLVSFVGRMDYFPNEQCMVDFCADVWPRLKRARPALKLKIIGAAPTARVQALGRLEGVTVTGAVPDVRPHVRGSALTIAPLKIARGTQNKILEAMAMGVPVIASGIAARGVDAVVGEHLLQADGADALHDAILRLIDQPAERARLAAVGRERVRTHHTWPQAMRRLDAVVERCMKPDLSVALAPA